MNHALPVFRALCAAALLVAGVCPAQPGPPVEKRRQAPIRVLIDRSLQETPVRLLAIGQGTVTFTPLSEPAEAPARTRPLADLLAIAPAPDAAPILPAVSNEAAPLVALVTTDGQRLVGYVREPGDGETTKGGEGAALVLESAALGRIVLPLDLALELEFIERPAGASSPSGADDTVILTNADRIDGFVESIGPTVIIRPKGADADTEIPLDRVGRILLSNPPKPSSGILLWLSDGSVVALDGALESDGQTLRSTLRLGKAPLSVPLTSVGALSLDAKLIRALASLTPASYRPAPERRWTRPPHAGDARTAPLGAADIEIPGPMTVEWVLPAGVSRLAGTAELARSTRGWGDCELIIEDLGSGTPAPAPQRLFSRRLTAQAPSARFDVALAPTPSADHRLRVTVDPGQGGPIQDRVFLRRPLLMLGDGGPVR